MPRHYGLAALVIASLAGSIVSAGAASSRQTPNPGPIEAPPPPPPVSVAPTTGINTSGHNQPGTPNTSTPGIIGTGAAPSGMRGDSRTAPGFPATGRR